MYLKKTGLADIIAGLPDVCEVGSRSAAVDVLVCALGFEDRTTAVLGELADAGALQGAHILLIDYPTNRQENARNEGLFLEVAEHCRGLIHVTYDQREFAAALDDALDEIGIDTASVVMDISTMSSYVFYPTFFALLERSLSLRIHYAEAVDYYPLRAEWEEVARRADGENSLFADAFENAGFQSHGLGEVFSFAPYYEYNYGNRPSTLAAIPNFSVLRMSAMVRRAGELQGARQDAVHWLIGEPPNEANRWRMAAVKRTNNLDNAGEAFLHQVSTLFYKETIEILDGIWHETRYDSAVAVATLGSKMQHLACALYCRLHKETSLWLSEPLEFTSGRYSSGVGRIRGLDFGPTEDLRRLLDSYGQYTWSMPGRSQEPAAEESE